MKTQKGRNGGFIFYTKKIKIYISKSDYFSPFRVIIIYMYVSLISCLIKIRDERQQQKCEKKLNIKFLYLVRRH